MGGGVNNIEHIAQASMHADLASMYDYHNVYKYTLILIGLWINNLFYTLFLVNTNNGGSTVF